MNGWWRSHKVGSGWRGMVVGSDFPLAVPIHTLITVGNVEEKVLFMMLLVQQSHGSWGGWNDVVYKEEESILSSQVDSFPDEEVKLAHCQVGGDKVFLLVQISYSGFGGFLHDYLKKEEEKTSLSKHVYWTRSTWIVCFTFLRKGIWECTKQSVKRGLKYMSPRLNWTWRINFLKYFTVTIFACY